MRRAGSTGLGADAVFVTCALLAGSRLPVPRAVYSLGAGPRRLVLHPQDRYLALRAARTRQRAPDIVACYAARFGVEGTIAQGFGVCNLRHARYRGQTKPWF